MSFTILPICIHLITWSTPLIPSSYTDNIVLIDKNYGKYTYFFNYIQFVKETTYYAMHFWMLLDLINVYVCVDVSGSLQAQYLIFFLIQLTGTALLASIENSVKIKSCTRNDISMNERSNIIRKS